MVYSTDTARGSQPAGPAAHVAAVAANPDGSVLVIVPEKPNRPSGPLAPSPAAPLDNNTFPKHFPSDTIDDMPYADYDIPPLPEVPLFPQSYGGHGLTPAGAAGASVGRSAADDAFVRRCRERDLALTAAMTAGDNPVVEAIEKADRSRPGQGDGNPGRRAPPRH